MDKKAKSAIKYTLSFLLAVVFVWFAFRKVDWQAFLSGLGQTRWIWVPAFFAASVGALIFRALRWKLLLRPLDPEVSAARLWDANNVGNLANMVLPGTGEFVRCGYVCSRCGYDKAITFEFSHFMSPQSAYLQAGHLYNRYREYFGI